MKERRRYQRVQVESLSSELKAEILGAGPTQLYDMSYEGAALMQPPGAPPMEVGQEFVLQLQASLDEAFLTSQVVRVSNNVIAAHFATIDVPARIIIDRVVTDRIIGLNMRFISPEHYNKAADFSHWYHGPKETNLYLWWKEGQLKKAQMDLASASLLFEGDSFFFENKALDPNVFPRLNNQQIALKVHAVVQQMEAGGDEALASFRQLIYEHIHG